MTLMEAAANRTAVIATDMSGINDVITDGESGLLIAERDVENLRLAIKKVLEDSDLRTTLAENLHLKAKDFDIEVVAAKYREVIKGVTK